MILSYRYRLLPTKAQHRALEEILESQRQLYNAALEERIGAYRKAGKTIGYIDQTKSLTELRRDDVEFDASWAKFLSMLRYKAEWAGARVIEVDPQYTTQDCSSCGAFVPKNLATRQHDCPTCGLSIDRDLNAARNILNRAGVGPGLRNVAEYRMRAGENLISANAPVKSAYARN